VAILSCIYILCRLLLRFDFFDFVDMMALLLSKYIQLIVGFWDI
jgi:hypothetical protein